MVFKFQHEQNHLEIDINTRKSLGINSNKIKTLILIPYFVLIITEYEYTNSSQYFVFGLDQVVNLLISVLFGFLLYFVFIYLIISRSKIDNIIAPQQIEHKLGILRPSYPVLKSIILRYPFRASQLLFLYSRHRGVEQMRSCVQDLDHLKSLCRVLRL